MMRALEASLGDDAEFKRLRRATDTALDIAGLRPDFILPATFVGRRLGLKGQELIVASLGRIAGWIAHAMEQYHAHELIRPRPTTLVHCRAKTETTTGTARKRPSAASYRSRAKKHFNAIIGRGSTPRTTLG